MKTKIILSILVMAFFVNTTNSQTTGIYEAIAGEFYSVYSGAKDFAPGGQIFGMNSFLIKGTNDTVWVFGTGCGNKTVPGDTSDVTFYREKDTGDNTWDCLFNAIKDAQYADTVITQHFGLTRSSVKLQFIVPHAHSDHAAPEYLDELNTLGYPVAGTNIYVHVEDFAMIGCTQPCCGYTPCEDRMTDKWFGASYNPPWPAALLNNVITVGQVGDSCGAVIKSFTSNALGTWKVMSGVDTSVVQSHTGGTVDIVNDTHEWHIVGSNLGLWAQCNYGASYTKIDIHDVMPPLSTSIDAQQNPINIITVYPNPTTTYFNVTWTGTNNISPSVVLYNSLGQKVYQTTNLTQNNIIIETENLRSGIYFLQVLDSNKSIIGTEKITVE